jgi:glycosyltransferase involved in cell wall biosynthesis
MAPQQHRADILFLSHLPGLEGGAEKSLFEIVKDLHSKGVSTHVVVSEDKELRAGLLSIGVSVTVIDFSWWTLPESDQDRQISARGIARLQELIAQIQPRLCATNSIVNPALALAAAASDIAHIWILREFGELDYGFKYIMPAEQVAQFVDELSDKVFCNSPAVLKHYEPLFTHNKDIGIVMPFIEPPKQFVETSTDSHAPATKAFTLVCVSKIHEAKGQLDAVKALKVLKDKGVSPQLLLIGKVESEVYYNEILSFATKHGLIEQITFAGHKSDPFSFMVKAQAALVCSRNEAFGRITVEAMLLGVPVIGANSGGTKDIITPGESGLLFKPGNAEDLASKILKLIEDPALRNSLAAKAKKEATSKYSREQVHKEFLSYVADMLKRNKIRRKRIRLAPLLGSGELISKLSSELANLSTKNTENVNLLNETKDELTAKTKELQDIYSSRSWKAVRLIRKVFKG